MQSNTQFRNSYYYNPSEFAEPQPSTSNNEEQLWEYFYQTYINPNACPGPDRSEPVPQSHNYAMNQWQHNVEPTYKVPDDYAVPPMRHPNDPSYIGYTPSSLYSTQWELNASNSQAIIAENHIGSGMKNFNIPGNYMMQKRQELDYFPAFGINQPVPENIAGPSVSLETIYPYTPLDTLLALSSIATTPDPASFPNTPQPVPSFQTFVLPNPVPQPQYKAPSKKRSRKAKKDTKPRLPTPKPKAQTHRPKGPSNVKSQEWLDKYFKDRQCQVCERKFKDDRSVRLLEHLVSVHCIQIIKNMYCYNEGNLARKATTKSHFIATEAQFDYTREHINTIGCSFCPDDDSLVLRPNVIETHLRTIHDLDKATVDKEMKSLADLDIGGFKNLNDKFL